ncbi:MAG: hypothetical protein WC780_16900 [Lentimicrobiaceae bacterium]|jgi:hypothetical protein
MKNLILVFTISILIVSCSKKNDSVIIPDNSGIIIKGKISGSHYKSANIKSANVLSLSDAKRVMVYNRNYMTLSNIDDSSFSVSAQMGTGVALLFLDANNRYIGNLSSKGLNMFPLGNLSNGENTTIDLSTLMLEGTNVIPSHDPLGNEIVISTSEINSLKVVGEYYESIAKNMDADNDSVPDILSMKQLVVYSTFGFTNCGRWGHNDTIPVINDSSDIFVNYQINIDGGKNLSYTDNNISFIGPSGEPYSDIVTAAQNHDEGGFNASIRRPSSNVPVGFQQGEILLPFKKGIYTLSLDNKNYTLNYANIDAFSNLVMIVPTLHTNKEGLLTSISLDYQLMNGTVLDNPSNMVTNVTAQIVNQKTGQGYDIWNGSTAAGPTSRLSIETGFGAIIPGTPVSISPFDMVALWYEDLLGNYYAIIWNSKR